MRRSTARWDYRDFRSMIWQIGGGVCWWERMRHGAGEEDSKAQRLSNSKGS